MDIDPEQAVNARTVSESRPRRGARLDASFLYLAFLLLAIGACVAHDQVERGRARSRLADAARAYVATLDPAQRERGVLPFDAANRRDWHFVPRERQGLKLADLGEEQKRRLHALGGLALSARGLERVRGIVELESILAELEGAPGKPNPNRDPGRYCVTVFGTPGEGAWGWRFEGHHLALNFTVIGDELVATTPWFLGANPARVASGPRAGFAVLGREEELARELVKSFTAEQKARATLPGAVPSDVILGPGRDAGFEEHLGLPLAAMTAAQRARADELLHGVIDDLEPETARAAFERFTRCGEDELRFAWCGGVRPGEPHYWRFDAVTAAIEWDDVQNGANHAHLLWRDLENDFGDDALRRHHELEHAHGSAR